MSTDDVTPPVVTMKKPRKPIGLNPDEITIITCALWHWEDCLRTCRASVDPTDVAKRVEYDRKIANIRNLKARMFRGKPRAK